MWRWILRIRREHGVVITMLLFLFLCLCLSYAKRNANSHGNNRQHIDDMRRMTNENWPKYTKVSGTRLRRHANFRQTRFVRVKEKQGEKLRTNFKRFENEKVKAGVKRNVPTKPKVIIKKHAMFRQRSFVEPRKNKQMGKSNGVVNRKRVVKNHWLILPQ